MELRSTAVDATLSCQTSKVSVRALTPVRLAVKGGGRAERGGGFARLWLGEER